ncbi:MAG: YhdP family protein [Gammaproteobacteria bacterium]
MNRFLPRIIKWLGISAAILLLIFAVMLGVARMFSPYLTRYQPQLETWISNALQRPVTVKQMTIRWRGLKPILVLDDITLWDATKTQSPLNVKELTIGISLLRSLVTWSWEPSSLTLSGAQLIVRQDQQGNISINGIHWTPPAGSTGKAESDQLIKWLLTRGRIRVSSVDVTWYGKNGLVLPLKGVGLKLTNSITGHQLAGAVTLDQMRRPAHISFILDFHGDVLQPATLQSELYLRIRQLDLPKWFGNFSYVGLQIKNGLGNYQGRISWSNQQLQKAQGEVDFNNLKLQAQNKQNDTFKHLDAHFDWHRTATGWTLQSDQVEVQWHNDLWPETYFKLQWNVADQKQLGSQIFEANFLNIADISQFLLTTTLLSDQQRTQLKTLQPSGLLQRIAIQHQGTQLLGNDLNGNMNLYKLGWKAWQKIPGISNLTGALRWNIQGGQLQLTSQKVVFDMPTLFPKAILLGKLNGPITWQKKPEGWQITASPFVIENKVLTLYPKLQMLLPTTGVSPTINLTAPFKIEDLHAALAYMPKVIMTPNLVKWLEQSNISGKASDGSLVLRGVLAQFPFDQGQGQFSIKALLHDATLRYHPEWIPIYHINGSINFVGRNLAINADTAQILKTHLTQVKASFQDLKNPILQVTGQVEGDMSDGFAFLHDSPLQKTIGKSLQGIDMQGPMDLNLALTIPLEEYLGKDKVLGKLALKNNTLTFSAVGLQLTQLQGALQFTEDSLSSDNIQGVLLNQPFTMNFVTLPAAKKQPKMTQVVLTGQANTKDIQQQFTSPWWHYVRGAIQYQATLKFPTAESAMPDTLTIVSDLRGLALNLPPPLNKSANQATPITVTASFAVAQPFKLLLNYANRLSTALTYKPSKQNYELAGGQIHLGAGKANFQTLPGLLITGQLTVLDLEEWQAVFEKMNAAEKQKGALSSIMAKGWLRAADVSFPQINLWGQKLNQVKLKVQPTNVGWNVNVNSDNVAGQVVVPNNFPRGSLTGDFQRLYLQATTSKNPIKITAAQVPSLAITVNDFRYADNRYGYLTLKTTTRDNQMEIEQLSVQSPVWQMDTTGRWRTTRLGKEQQTTLDGIIQSQNVGKMLSDLNISQDLASGKGGINFHLSWPDAPFQFALANLNGKINLKVNQGRIINLKQSTQTEIGLGRVLNLLSLQTIPRRLRLDFSDLTSSGFAFDVLQGDFLLEGGNMTTSNTYLDGPVAKVTLNGRIGLRARDYDVALNVTPYVTSSLPVVATIAGGPIVGAITWVANKIIGSEVSKIATYHYRITGSWQKPEIVKFSEYKPRANTDAANTTSTTASIQ